MGPSQLLVGHSIFPMFPNVIIKHACFIEEPFFSQFSSDFSCPNFTKNWVATHGRAEKSRLSPGRSLKHPVLEMGMVHGPTSWSYNMWTWYMMIHDDTWWYMMMYDHTLWYILINDMEFPGISKSEHMEFGPSGAAQDAMVRAATTQKSCWKCLKVHESWQTPMVIVYYINILIYIYICTEGW